MSTQEVRPASKWSAIRSKAVPSNVIPKTSDTSLTALDPEQMATEQIGAKGKLRKAGKPVTGKTALQHRLNRPPAFAGSTGSSH